MPNEIVKLPTRLHLIESDFNHAIDVAFLSLESNEKFQSASLDHPKLCSFHLRNSAKFFFSIQIEHLSYSSTNIFTLLFYHALHFW